MHKTQLNRRIKLLCKIKGSLIQIKIKDLSGLIVRQLHRHKIRMKIHYFVMKVLFATSLH